MSLKLKCIELYLQIKQGASIDEIRNGLDLQYLELYPLIEILETQGRVQFQNGEFYVTGDMV